MVFFRKYRPQILDELDSSVVRETLSNILSQDSISHAFLFTGPKGLGKTSTARIVAKVLNCTAKRKKGEIEPCNKCEECVSITNGTNMDILEIDGASNRGIDEIRDLRDKVRLSPLSASKKVYIIDEVHMLTTEAFNALLKTLEEPPSHVVFILCTTEPHKVPATIVSRCTHIIFPLAQEDDLVRSLKRIAKGEKLDADDRALHSIAKLSEGSFRDAAKILEELVAFSKDKKITEVLVDKRYNVSSIVNLVSKMINMLSKQDTKAGIELVGKLIEQGVDVKYFIEQLINELHVQLLQKVRAENSKFEIVDIKELMRLFTKAHGELKYAVLPQLPLEIAIIEWGTTSNVVRGPVPGLHPASAQLVSPPSAEPNPMRAVGNPSTRATPHSDSLVSPLRSNTQSDNILDQLIEKIKPLNHSIAGVLRGCKLKSYDEKELIIETGYKFHKDRLDEKKTLAIIEKVLQEISGKKITVSIILSKGGEKL